MRIFISWSGERSRAVANILQKWLPDLIEGLDIWTAAKDIEAGKRWNTVIGSQLEVANFGILCVTPKNVTAPWLLFEAGALSKSLSASKVIPYLINLTPSELEGPLQQFQSVIADKEGTFQLARSILFTRDENSNGEERLRRIFDSLWTPLENSMKSLPYEEKGPSTHELVEVGLGLLKKQETWHFVQELQAAPTRLLFEWMANLEYSIGDLTDPTKKAIVDWIKQRIELENEIKPFRNKLSAQTIEIGMDQGIGYGNNFDTLSKEYRDLAQQMGSVEERIESVDKKLIEALKNNNHIPNAG